MGLDSLKTRRTLKVGKKSYDYYSLKAAERELGDLSRLPFSLKVILENLLRHEDGRAVRVADIKAVGRWLKKRRSTKEIAFRPARVLMQDFTGVPAVVDLASMRDAVAKMGGDPKKINPGQPVELVIDHSVQVDKYASPDAAEENARIEFERNDERRALAFLARCVCARATSSARRRSASNRRRRHTTASWSDHRDRGSGCRDQEKEHFHRASLSETRYETRSSICAGVRAAS